MSEMSILFVLVSEFSALMTWCAYLTVISIQYYDNILSLSKEQTGQGFYGFLRVRVPLGSFTFVCQLTILVRLALDFHTDFHYDAMDLYRKRQKESTREKMNRESMVYWRNGGKKEISGNVKLIFGSNLSRKMVLCWVSFSPNRNDRTLVENYPLFDISSEPGFFFIHYD